MAPSCPGCNGSRAGISAIAGPDHLQLITAVPAAKPRFHHPSPISWSSAGQRETFTLIWHPSHEDAPPPVDPMLGHPGNRALVAGWSARCTYNGEWREQVMRSLITLKALTYDADGRHRGRAHDVAARSSSAACATGIIAIAGCATRRSRFVRSSRPAISKRRGRWRAWLLGAVAGRPAETQIMYGLAGERRLDRNRARLAAWLRRVAAGACRQCRRRSSFSSTSMAKSSTLFITAALGRPGSIPMAGSNGRALVEFVETAWQRPDEGIWEVRGPRRHFTHSKVMAWVALDRGIKAAERLGFEGPLDRWRAVRDTIHAQVCDQGFDTDTRLLRAVVWLQASWTPAC